MSYAAIGIASSKLILVFVLLGYALLTGRIAEKAGFSRWWCLTMVVPVLNLFVVWAFAFSAWPAHKSNLNAEGADGLTSVRT